MNKPQYGVCDKHLWITVVDVISASMGCPACRAEQAEKKLAAWGLSDISDKECFDQAQGWRQRAEAAEQEVKALKHDLNQHMDIDIHALEQKLKAAQKDVAFYRCCALSGEVPKDGSEPSAILG